MTCHVAMAWPFINVSTTPIRARQVDPTLRERVFVLGSNVTWSGDGILSTLVVVDISLENSLFPLVLNALT